MADFFDITSDGPPSNAAMVRRARQMRLLLVDELAAQHANIREHIIPLLTDVAVFLMEADVSSWSPNDISASTGEVLALARLANRINALLDLYCLALSPNESPTEAGS